MRSAIGLLILVLLVGCTSGTLVEPVETPPATVWQPRPGLTWHLQYAGELTATEAEVVNVDGHETSAATVARLHADGKRVICYFNAGGWEDWRPDQGDFPESVIGEPLDDWPGERWLDIRQVDVLLPIMVARMEECAAKGFDAVDPDNLDGWQAETDFQLTRADTLAYLAALSREAHALGLAIGLKNAAEAVPQAEPLVEFAVTEECLIYSECYYYEPMLAAGKAVFHVEYTGRIADICASVPAGFSTVRKHLELDAWSQSC